MNRSAWEAFLGETVVIKYGGSAMADRALRQSFAQDVVHLRRLGLRPVIVHGGGPQVTAMLERLGIAAEFAGGLRVTSETAMEVVRMVLTGQVQPEVVGLVNEHGPLAVGMSGEDAHLFTATPRTASVSGREVDLGRVGEITHVNTEFVETVLDCGFVPVVSSVARDDDGAPLNVNADSAAASLAVALGAARLIVLTDVAGLYPRWPADDQVVAQLTASELCVLLPGLGAGMAPKMEACLAAVRNGVERAHVVDGRVPHVLLDAFAEPGPGTNVLPDCLPASVTP